MSPLDDAVAPDPMIAIIDDDEPLRLALAGFVRSLGYRASAFASAEDFLAGSSQRDSDVIVTDIQMPGMSGVDLKQRLSELGCRVPVIMVTARTETALHERALASGAHCLLKKPFAPETLVECIDKALA